VCETVPNDKGDATALLIADPAGRCTQVNPTWTEITGLDSGLNAGDGWLDFAHPDDRERLQEQWAACVLRHGDLRARVRLKTS
jgi:PAS domain S-box-containing protein